MKKVILLGVAGIILFTSTAALAQESSDKRMNANWASLDFGFVSINSSDEWSNKILQSSSFGLNVVEYKLPILNSIWG